ncbi:MAG: hypothetical protein ACP5N3_02495 [Candidatus Nanoarchaeia archaeon]
MTSERKIFVTFGNNRLENDFETLKEGKTEDKRLYSFINRAILDLKGGNCGVKIPRRLWPKFYIKEYGITNLWKYDLPNGWRLVYTIKANDTIILNIILEWFSHKEYEKRFEYLF